jgi:hypothetical protein
MQMQPGQQQQQMPPMSEAQMALAMEQLKVQLEKMPEEDRLKLLSQLSAEDQKVLLPGGKASLGEKGIQEEQKGIEIVPEAGFTLKTKCLKANKKVFINVCTSEELDAPGLKKRLNDAGDEVEGYNVPMSVGPVRACQDKAGAACMVYDMVVNPKVMEEIREDVTGKQRDFICQLGLQCGESKYKLELDKRYKLPNLDYIGEKASQWIKDRRAAPKIEEVSSSSGAKGKAAAGAKGKAAAGAKDAAAAVAPVPFVPETLKELPVRCRWLCEHYALSTVDSDSSVINAPEYEPLTTYVEPVQILPPSVQAYVLIADPITLQADAGSDIDVSKHITVQGSPFKLQVRVVGYKPVTYYFPCAVQPQLLASRLTRAVGATTKTLRLLVHCPLDRRQEVQVPETHAHYNLVPHHIVHSWDALNNGDPGSRLWLVANALKTDGEGGAANPYAVDQADLDAAVARAARSEVLTGFEDQFVVYSNSAVPRTAADVGASSGSLPASATSGVMARKSAIDDEILPEDRFHVKDASSQYIINQREQAIADKHTKADE